MFSHIRTVAPIHLKESSNLDLKEEPSIRYILNQCNSVLPDFEDVNDFELRIFYLSDILSWDLVQDRYYYENLKYLLVKGRRKKQLVILQLDREDQMKEIKDKQLYEVIMSNTLNLEDKTRGQII
ncbi:hypothetical protein PUS82_00380 [Cytobacillus firmus]|uniref:hypothetical protein n=1 Tax=Cytobacillus firmus TaxID=1399 RepID=UPI00237C4C16|nr:hypothetical protein [Cytobacillus firmus]MDD9309787.1 hypothetical protein [Cytobacillus firmus]